MNALNIATHEPLSLLILIVNLLIGGVLAFMLRWHYIRYGRTLSNREGFSSIFPIIVFTTLLIIAIVKSSLALSLGLIGALSIIRFRTPIKEPEELAYLFVAISIGIGLGANQTLPVIIATLVTMTVMAQFSKSRRHKLQNNLYLSIEVSSCPDEQRFFDELTEIIAGQTSFCDLHRLDLRDNSAQVTYFIDIPGSSGISPLLNAIHSMVPEANITILDQKKIPGV